MDKIYLYLNIFEALYVFYIMVLFKTKYSIHIPFEKVTQYHKFLMHPINTGVYESKICPLGKLVGILIPIWILIRVMMKDKQNISLINNIIWGIIFFCSFVMNINAFIYFIPAFLIETYLYFYKPDNKIHIIK